MTQTTIEASELGLKPGDWPTAMWIEAGGASGRYERKTCKRDRDGDIVYVRYVRKCGAAVLVYND